MTIAEIDTDFPKLHQNLIAEVHKKIYMLSLKMIHDQCRNGYRQLIRINSGSEINNFRYF
jgi:hypothetical protein